MDGWIKLHRKFVEWEWYDDAHMVKLFLHLLLNANHEPKQWRGVTVNPGQIITGTFSLSESTGLSIQTLRTCLNKLKSTNEITIKSTNRFSIITIIKWDSYQSQNGEGNKPTNKPTNKQLTNNQQTTNNKQECKEGEEVIHPLPAKPKQKKERTYHIFYNLETKLFEGITMEEIKDWERAYNLVNIRDTLHDMCVKIPGKYENKQDWKRFITNWLGGEQKRARERNERRA